MPFFYIYIILAATYIIKYVKFIRLLISYGGEGKGADNAWSDQGSGPHNQVSADSSHVLPRRLRFASDGLFVCLFVCLLSTLHIKLLMALDEIFRKGKWQSCPAKKVMFLHLMVCWFLCLSVINFTHKVINGFG